LLHQPSLYFAAVVEIIGSKHIGVMTFTFHGHVTSSVMWQCSTESPLQLHGCSSAMVPR